LTHHDLWRAQIQRLLEHVPTRPTDVLDLGCGPGVSAFVLAEHTGANVVGLDYSQRMVARAKAAHRSEFVHLPNVRFLCGDACALDLPDASVDLITGHSFLYLVSDRPAALREARRVLRPGGTLVFMEPSAGGFLPTAAWTSRGAALPHLLRAPWQTTRFCLSMVSWRFFGNVSGMMSPDLVRDLFGEAGFTSVETHPTLAGLGLHCVGRA